MPLDYQRPGGTQIDLAVIRHQATDPSHRVGTIFYNPGGPGQAVATFLTTYNFFPDPLRARFDIVTWDPRGIGNSTAVQCFATQADEENFLAGVGRAAAEFPFGTADTSNWIQRYATLGKLCKQRNSNLLRHVGTADSARDMDQLRAAMGIAQLNYFGQSYGTYLGATYINMFPSRVRAAVLDANIDPVAWNNPQRQANGGTFFGTFVRQGSSQGAADTLGAFLDLCGQTDTAHCAFSAGSPTATRTKFATLLGRLQQQPVSADITYAKVGSGAVSNLYEVADWTKEAQDLQAAWVGTTSLPPVPPNPSPGPLGRVAAAGTVTKYAGIEQLLSIICSENPNPPVAAIPDVERRAVARWGDVAARFWTWASEPCSTWPVRAAARYTGPWNRRTANPVLVVNNTHDPATPYQNARANAQRFARARLLTVDGYGHVALNQQPDDCANAYESAYFIDKTLPPPGARCTGPQPFTGSQ